MGNLDPAKIAIVLVVALVVLGPEKLPGFTRQMGAWWGEFQRIKARLQAEVNGAVGQINNVAAPIAETFNTASSGIRPFVESFLSGPNSNDPTAKPPASMPTADANQAPRGDVRKVPAAGGGKDSGWGMDEAESGYRYGDPRLN